MAVPKRRKSRSRVRMRRSHHKAVVASVSACPVCGSNQQAHRVCPGCGEYRGRKVISITE